MFNVRSCTISNIVEYIHRQNIILYYILSLLLYYHEIRVAYYIARREHIRIKLYASVCHIHIGTVTANITAHFVFAMTSEVL